MQNAYIERFNRIFREDILDAYWSEDSDQLRGLVHNCRDDYNLNHPHKSLNGMPPVCYYKNAVNSGKVQPRKSPPDFSTINSNSNMNNKEILSILEWSE